MKKSKIKKLQKKIDKISDVVADCMAKMQKDGLIPKGQEIEASGFVSDGPDNNIILDVLVRIPVAKGKLK